MTFVTQHRWVLPENARDIALRCCIHDHNVRYDLHAVVIMPDHAHLILTPLINFSAQRVYTLAEILDAIKGASAHLINRALHRHGCVWQYEYFDHVLRSSEALDEKIGYILDNPVRRGLVTLRQNYRWTWVADEVGSFAELGILRT